MIKRKNNKTMDQKRCPFFNEQCITGGCAIYHEDFARCGFELAVFNMFKLSDALNKFDPMHD